MPAVSIKNFIMVLFEKLALRENCRFVLLVTPSWYLYERDELGWSENQTYAEANHLFPKGNSISVAEQKEKKMCNLLPSSQLAG